MDQQKSNISDSKRPYAVPSREKHVKETWTIAGVHEDNMNMKINPQQRLI